PNSGAHSTEETHIRLVLSGNPHTSAIALARLADDANQQVRCRVAEHVNVPVDILAKLANDFSSDVRVSVSENPKLPASILETLARDSCDDVRLGLAHNPHLCELILKELTNDTNVFVADAAKTTLAAKPGSAMHENLVQRS
ncbi:MAG: hypothetical protein ACRD3W_08910, partial [Terriglobales bacterium]